MIVLSKHVYRYRYCVNMFVTDRLQKLPGKNDLMLWLFRGFFECRLKLHVLPKEQPMGWMDEQTDSQATVCRICKKSARTLRCLRLLMINK